MQKPPSQVARDTRQWLRGLTMRHWQAKYLSKERNVTHGKPVKAGKLQKLKRDSQSGKLADLINYLYKNVRDATRAVNCKLANHMARKAGVESFYNIIKRKSLIND